MTATTTSLDDLKGLVHSLMPKAKEDLATLVSYKSVADARQYPPEECHKAAQWVADAFSHAGLTEVGLHETPDGSRAVIGSYPAPAGAPTVLLYCHYDVQPPLGESEWNVPIWELTDKNGRWYGRGSADCKGNIVAHLIALRALGGGDFPVGVKLVAEGSEEQGTGGLEAFVPKNADLLRADAILVCDTGNAAVGVPTFTSTLRGQVNAVVTVSTMKGAMHSGMFGGPAPDALASLIQILSTLRDAKGNTTVRGLDGNKTWQGVQYAANRFRKDAGVLDSVDLAGDGTVADMVWARPTLTVLGMDVPAVVGSSAAIQPTARARLNLRIPPGIEPEDARDALERHIKQATPLHAQVKVDIEAMGSPFQAASGGPAHQAMSKALERSYDKAPTSQGQGGSIPLCNVFKKTYPDAEIMLLGVEEPQCLIHAPNESVDPAEIEHMALAEAFFLATYTR